jgi:hypothetical protein
VSGFCVNGCEYSTDCSFEYCNKKGNMCVYDICSANTEISCKEWSSNCIYSDDRCKTGGCEDIILENECEGNLRCKIIYDIENANKKCWTDSCEGSECNWKNCVRSEEECIFDNCGSLNNDECNNNDKCVYDSSNGCHENKCSSLGNDVMNCNLNLGKCVVVNGECKNDCRFSENCDFNYCKRSEGLCSVSECVEHKVSDCYKKDGCIWNNSNELCNSGICRDLNSLDECEAPTNGNKCSYISGTCTENSCKIYNGDKSGCELNKLCMWEESGCIVSKCAKYTSEECQEGRFGCIYKEGYCISGVCALLNVNNDECTDNVKCKKIINIENEDIETPVCWENNCSEFNVNECPSLGCVVSSNSSNSKCEFDECNVFGSVECNYKTECVYTFTEGCHKDVCSNIGADLESCRMNNKCKVVKGICESDCSESYCDSQGYCVKENDVCTYDSCSQWEAVECYGKEGCIWDDGLMFNGKSGLCKTGNCENLLNEDDCSSILNNDRCAYVGGLCIENPCRPSDCQGDVIASGCKISSRETCVVDECMKYDENKCKTDGLSNCVVISSNNKNWCVFGGCLMLKDNADCEKNEVRCKVVKDTCVDNPCSDAECLAPSCFREEEQCVYDECAQYIPSGIFLF